MGTQRVGHNSATFRFVIAFLPRSKHLLISWLQSPFAVILEPRKIKSVTVSIVFQSICYEVMGPGVIILVFWMLSQWSIELVNWTDTKALEWSHLVPGPEVKSSSEITNPTRFTISYHNDDVLWKSVSDCFHFLSEIKSQTFHWVRR